MSGAHGLQPTGVTGDRASAVHRLDPRAKVIGLVAVTLVAVSTPLGAWPAWGACAAVLVAVAALARVGPAEIARRARTPLLLVLAVGITLPFVRTGGRTWDVAFLTLHERGLDVFATVAAKASIGTLSAVLLMATTSLPDVLSALERLRVPRLFVLIAGLTYRYLFVLMGEAARMKAALAARNWRPRSAAHAGAAGRVAGALFLRAHARGERVHLAMVARGYSGTMPAPAAMPLARPDVLFLALVLGTIVAARLLAGLAA
jgi:cobalt/nickel transport system permease protein